MNILYVYFTKKNTFLIGSPREFKFYFMYLDGHKFSL